MHMYVWPARWDRTQKMKVSQVKWPRLTVVSPSLIFINLHERSMGCFYSKCFYVTHHGGLTCFQLQLFPVLSVRLHSTAQSQYTTLFQNEEREIAGLAY